MMVLLGHPSNSYERLRREYLVPHLSNPLYLFFSSKLRMQAVGMKIRSSLHSVYDLDLMTRGILCIGTGAPLTREQGDYFASEFPAVTTIKLTE